MKQLLKFTLLTPLLFCGHVQAQADFSGVYMRAGGGEGDAGTMVSQWNTEEELPFNATGRAVFDANVPGKGPRQVMPAFGNDPLAAGNPPGLYRTLVYPRAIEIVQTPEKVIQLFEWGKNWRAIYTDGRDASEGTVAGPFWYGYSAGRWEGDTLVLTTTGLDGRAWFDEWGTPISDFAEIEERWSRVDEDTIQMVMTINDPEYYSRPWTSKPRLYNEQSPDTINGQLYEQIFAPIDELQFNIDIRDPAAGQQGAN